MNGTAGAVGSGITYRVYKGFTAGDDTGIRRVLVNFNRKEGLAFSCFTEELK